MSTTPDDRTGAELHPQSAHVATTNEAKQAEEALRRSAERDRLRAALADALRSSDLPEDIEAEATRLLAEHLRVRRCHYLNIDEGDGELYGTLHPDHDSALDGTARRHRLSDFGSRLLAQAREGRSITVSNVADDPRLSADEKAAATAVQVGSYLAVPLLERDRIVAMLVVHHIHPRSWSPEDVAMVEEVAERVWSTLERARTEKELRQSRGRYQTLLESIDQGFCVFEVLFDDREKPIDYRFLEVNSAFEQHTGLVDAVGKRVHEMVPDLEQHWAEIYGRVATTGEPHHFEEGSEAMGRIFQVSASRVGEPHERKVALIFTDITERRRSERALRQSEERLRLASAAARLGVFSWDMAEQRAHYENDRMYEIFGRSPEEGPLSRTEFESSVLEPEDLAVFREVARDRSAFGEPFSLECRIRRQNDGKRRWIELSGRFDLGPDGTPRRLIGVVADVTDRKLTEHALREANRRKDEYLAMLGHELRNPLAAIRSASELVEQLRDGDPRLQRASSVLSRQSTHMARLIEGLLEVSRLARGKITLQRDNLDLREIVDAVLDDRRTQFESKDLTLERELPSEPLVAFVDRVRCTQVVDNLIANAIKFTPSPGAITVSLQPRNEWAVLRIRDTGTGIVPEKLESIFEPFHQEEQDIARVGGGLGLGLALAKGLVELHEGEITAHSEGPGTGSELSVRLPLGVGPSQTSKSDTPTTEARRSILIVEDNLDTATMMRDLLELHGYRVTLAESATEALQLLRAAPRDVVLCDLGLPGMTGCEFAQEVRADPELREIELVAVTGYGQPEDRERTATAGFNAHLTKPVSLADLVEVCEKPTTTDRPA